MAYEFHYTPTGTGVISGKEVLEQTEDAINDLGNTAISGVQEELDKAEQALTNSQNAVDDAQTALNTANNAEGVAIQAQTDVGNLSGTVTNIGNRVTTAEGNITNLQGRMTTAEGNITNLQGRMTTAETNIGNLQTAVSTAQATANSAQQTATTARQQSYVFRYSGTAITDNSTIAYSTIDNTDNIKSGDKILDVDGKLFEITAVDTTNQTVTVGTALIDLALDSNVVHKSGNETVGGEKTFDAGQINVKSTMQEMGVIPQTSTLQYMPFMDKNNVIHGLVGLWDYDNGASEIQLNISDIFKNGVKDKTGTLDTSFFSFGFLSTGVKFTTFGGQLNNSLIPLVNSTYDVGSSSYKWKSINGLEPSSLSLPDLNNAVDISGYITDLTGSPNVYSPPVNGYIAIRSTTANVLGIVENTTGMGSYSRGSNQVLAVNLPVVKGSSISIYAICSSLTHAKFIPCQGNI